MAKKDRAIELRQKSKFAAMEGLRRREGFPVPPRKAMSQARKTSKKLPYPLAPYPSANPLQLYRWAAAEWQTLGRWQGLAAPVVILVALLTWEKEKAMREGYMAQVDKVRVRQQAAEVYGAYGRRPKRRKLLGVIPLGR